MRLVDLYREDLNQHTTVELKTKVRRDWFRAVGITLQERSIEPFPVPKRGTHGQLTDRFPPFWRNQSDDELETLFKLLKPYFAAANHRYDDLT